GDVEKPRGKCRYATGSKRLVRNEMWGQAHPPLAQKTAFGRFFVSHLWESTLLHEVLYGASERCKSNSQGTLHLD
ncbi:MAG: hypothetical protein KBB98_02300, partial [Clostridia bacterium]|nr:hypothetical protein [Clostridia bacterium]